MSRLRSDVATVAEWGFIEDAELMDALRRQANSQAESDPEDALQETILWLAVRPELHTLSIPFILRHTRSRLRDVRNTAKAREVETSFEEYFEYE